MDAVAIQDFSHLHIVRRTVFFLRAMAASRRYMDTEVLLSTMAKRATLPPPNVMQAQHGLVSEKFLQLNHPVGSL